MDHEPPKLTRDEGFELIHRWLDSREGLEVLRSGMAQGSTLEDALRFHRKVSQLRRQPSKVMIDDDA